MKEENVSCCLAKTAREITLYKLDANLKYRRKMSVGVWKRARETPLYNILDVNLKYTEVKCQLMPGKDSKGNNSVYTGC